MKNEIPELYSLQTVPLLFFGPSHVVQHDAFLFRKQVLTSGWNLLVSQ